MPDEVPEVPEGMPEHAGKMSEVEPERMSEVAGIIISDSILRIGCVPVFLFILEKLIE